MENQMFCSFPGMVDPIGDIDNKKDDVSMEEGAIYDQLEFQ